MKKSNNAQEANVVVVPTILNAADAAACKSYETVLAEVLKTTEKRLLKPDAFVKAQTLTLPTSADEFVNFAKENNSDVLFAAFALAGKTELQRLAKLYLAKGAPFEVLKCHAVALKGAADGKGGERLAGQMTAAFNSIRLSK